MDDICQPIRRQIALNTAIAEEGLRGRYGAMIGRESLPLVFWWTVSRLDTARARYSLSSPMPLARAYSTTGTQAD